MTAQMKTLFPTYFVFRSHGGMSMMKGDDVHHSGRDELDCVIIATQKIKCSSTSFISIHSEWDRGKVVKSV